MRTSQQGQQRDNIISYIQKDGATALSYAPLYEARVGDKGRLKSGPCKLSLRVGNKGYGEICFVKGQMG